MRHFCTLFDRNYLYKGLTLYFSLIKHCPEFKLWILCLDDLTYRLLKQMNLERVELVSLSEFENADLLRVKQDRNVTEYSWTCTSNFCRYLINNKDLGSLTYLDADLYFFDNPTPLFKEIGDHSIAIIEHRFPAGQEKFEQAVGRFNVGFVYFKKDDTGLKAVNWWADRALEWCYYRLEDGKYGDQMYLDDWPTRFKNVLVIKNDRVGSAPWNIKEAPLVTPIFYHFHAFKLISRKKFIEAAGYFVPNDQRRLFYRPYIEDLQKTMTFFDQINPGFNFGFSQLSKKDMSQYLIYHRLIPEPIIFGLTKLKRIVTNRQIVKNLIKKTLRWLLSPLILQDYFKFKKLNNNRFCLRKRDFYPQIRDKTLTTGFDRHYVYHVAWAVRKVLTIKPEFHTDISSSLYFSATLSASIPVKFYDFRPAKLVLDNLTCLHANLTNLPFPDQSIHSLSCMHTIEHIGLGRYGDKIDPEGDLKAIAELNRVLAKGGSLLFVVPIGRPKIEFNAHRIYSYEMIMNYFSDLTLKEFYLIPEFERDGQPVYNASQESVNNQNYACGCFWFIKP